MYIYFKLKNNNPGTRCRYFSYILCILHNSNNIFQILNDFLCGRLSICHSDHNHSSCGRHCSHLWVLSSLIEPLSSSQYLLCIGKVLLHFLDIILYNYTSLYFYTHVQNTLDYSFYWYNDCTNLGEYNYQVI